MYRRPPRRQQLKKLKKFVHVEIDNSKETNDVMNAVRN